MQYIKYKYGNVCERDINIMLLNSFAMSIEFAGLFLSKIKNIDINSPKIIDIELSKSDPTYGESDVTVRFKDDEHVYALLIEDKVNAQAQPDQYYRYEKRGGLGINKNEYEQFFIFICAPEKYLNSNEEARLYPYSVSYEEMLEFFQKRKDKFSEICKDLLQQAIEGAKLPYQKIVDAKATEFWIDYIAYTSENYPDLQLQHSDMEKSKSGGWTTFYTPMNMNRKLYIHHKMDRGFVDLTFSGMADRQVELSEWLKKQIGDYEDMGLGIRPAGKSAVLRKDLSAKGVLNFQESFGNQNEIAQMHFEAIKLLHCLSKKFDKANLVQLLQKRDE